MFDSRSQRDEFYVELFNIGLKYCQRKYFDGYEQQFNAHDVVANAILYIDKQVRSREFCSLGHIRAWFFLNLRSQFCNQIKSCRRHSSLNAPVKGDGETTLEDFFASRLLYPTLEDEESAIPVSQAVKSLSQEQQDLIWKVWVEGKKVEEIGGNVKYLNRLLADARLKLMRRLVGKTTV